MKLHTKLTLFSITLIVIAVVACCAIILAYTNQHALEGVTEAGLSDYFTMYYSFSGSIQSDLPVQSSVRRSLLINKFRSISSANEFTLRKGDDFLCNNIGFDIESLIYNAQTSSDGRVKYRIVRIKQEDYFLAQSTLNIGSEDYDLSFARNITAVTQDVQSLVMQCAIAGLIVTLAATGLMWLVVFRALQPIKQLQSGANDLAAGHYENRIGIKGKGELAVLAADFNSMAGAIESNIDELHETAERQQAFINGLSHEMKTPITSIMLSAETLLGRKVSSEEMNRSLERIYDQSKWLERLSQKLMTLVMLQGEIEKKPENAIELLEAVKTSTWEALQEKDMKLAVQCDMGLLPMDFDLMRSALVNLVDNARKASGCGQRIEIHAYDFTFEVIDYGTGIPLEEVEKVLEPFYMVDRSRNKRNGGSGLGLALVKQIVEAHGAQLMIESMLHKGTTVRIVFDELQ